MKKILTLILLLVMMGCTMPKDGYTLSGKIENVHWRTQICLHAYRGDVVCQISDNGVFRFTGLYPNTYAVMLYLDTIGSLGLCEKIIHLKGNQKIKFEYIP